MSIKSSGQRSVARRLECEQRRTVITGMKISQLDFFFFLVWSCNGNCSAEAVSLQVSKGRNLGREGMGGWEGGDQPPRTAGAMECGQRGGWSVRGRSDHAGTRHQRITSPVDRFGFVCVIAFIRWRVGLI